MRYNVVSSIVAGGTAAMSLHDAGALIDFPEGQAIPITLGERPLMLIRWADQIYAITAICPHQLVSFEGALVRAKLSFVSDHERGAPAADDDVPVIRCPRHGWEYDLATGKPVWESPGPLVRTFPVTLRDGRVLVAMPPTAVS